MKKTKRIIRISFLLSLFTIFIVSCKKNNTAIIPKDDIETNAVNEDMEKYSPDQLKVIDRMNSKLGEIAKNLAYSLKEPSYRHLVKNEVGKKFDDDYDVLLYHLMDRKLQGGKTLRESFSNTGAKVNANQKISIAALFQKAIEEIPLIQVAIPVKFNQWDATQFIPKVAVLPVDYDEATTKTIPAYDYMGNKYEIDAINKPNEPIIVISLNERVDMDKNGRYYYSVSKEAVPENILDLKKYEIDIVAPLPVDVDPPTPPSPTPPGSNSPCAGPNPYRINGNKAYLKNIWIAGHLVGKIEGWPAGDLELDIRVFAIDKTINFNAITEVYSVRNEILNRHNVQYTWNVSKNLGIVDWDNTRYGQTLNFYFVENDREIFGENSTKEVTFGGSYKIDANSSVTASIKFNIGKMDEEIGGRTVDQFPVPPQFRNGKCFYDVGSEFGFVLE